MRCPKCRYISFERGERCRNCGYDFSLAVEVADADLPLHGREDDQPLGPMADLALGDLAPAVGADVPRAQPDDFDLRGITASPATSPVGGRSAQLGAGLEPSLFGAPPATPAPRAPLAVRRSSAPDPPRRRAASLERPRLALESEANAPGGAGFVDPPEPAPAAVRPVARSDSAGAVRRLAAGALDAGILLSIDLAVLYFTLRLCGLGFGEVLVIPPVPFIGFLLLLNGGYATAFTAASGQTIGKMASGIKVIGAPGGEAAAGDRISFGFAVLRTAAYLASALPVGLGFLPALVGRDRRALHDRLAETRVVCVLRDRTIG
jgi:uncharacterized RDD family membrane protein YckC